MSNFFSGFSFPDLSGLLSSGARDAEPYPGYSLGRPYEVKTEDELFWKPTPVTEATASEARGKIQEGCGVGLKLIWDDDVRTLLVGEVMPDSAAARSGRVRVDDVVCEIDGLNVTGQPIDVVESLLRGPEGSILKLVLMRGDESGTVDEIAITLSREAGDVSDTIRLKRTGVGIVFWTDPVDNSVRVRRVVKGGPAEKSGLVKPDDILFEVDGTNVFREGLDVIAQLLLGEPGTLVRLLILRGTRIFIEVNLQREAHARMVTPDADNRSDARTHDRSDMEGILRYVKSLKSISSKHDHANCNDQHEMSHEDRKKRVRTPASFRLNP